MHSRLWALVPALSIVGFVVVGTLAEEASAQALTYVALVAVPLLAALALGWLMHGARPGLALLVVPLFVLAWVDRGALVGQGAGVLLSALSCVALGALIAGVTPACWLAVGIVAMACADTALVVSSLLQAPNNALNAAHPVGGLPRLQAELLGSAVMGYGDLFVAGVLGGLLACLPDCAPEGTRASWGAPDRVSFGVVGQRTGTAATGRSRQLTGAVLVALLAVVFDLLFFVIDELPATVPVASALLVLLGLSRRQRIKPVEARPQKVPVARAPAPR